MEICSRVMLSFEENLALRLSRLEKLNRDKRPKEKKWNEWSMSPIELIYAQVNGKASDAN